MDCWDWLGPRFVFAFMPEKTSMQRLLTTFRFSSVFGLFHQINTVKPKPVATPVENLINQKIVKEVRTLAFSLFKCTVP